MRGLLNFPGLLVPLALVQLAVFVLLIRLLDWYEREPMALIALVAAWGSTGAVVLALLGNFAADRFLSPPLPAPGHPLHPLITTPIVEESAKGLALVAILLLSRLLGRLVGTLEFEGVTDGIVYGAAVGLGFAFTEDVAYLLRAAVVDLGQAVQVFSDRVGFFSVQSLGHAVYAAMFGVGLGLATWRRGWVGTMVFPLVGLAAGAAMHAVHNRSVDLERAAYQTNLADLGFLLAASVAMGLWLMYERKVIREELAEEAASGLISPADLELLPRYLPRALWYLELLKAGRFERWRILRRIHTELVDLAFLKRRVRRKRGDSEAVERRRQRIERILSRGVE